MNGERDYRYASWNWGFGEGKPEGKEQDKKSFFVWNIICDWFKEVIYNFYGDCKGVIPHKITLIENQISWCLFDQ